MVAEDLDEKDAQDIINEYLRSSSRRRYDTSRVDSCFPNVEDVCCTVNRKARHVFARYLTIHDDQFSSLIERAVGHAVDPYSEAFSKTWTKLIEWRKNWLCHHKKGVDTLHAALLKENLGYSSLLDDHLRDAYVKHLTQENFYHMTSKPVR